MAATIKMVAEHAGVSTATVSKYLNGGNVYEENKIRIQKAIDELDYKINDVARSLRTNRTYTVGVLAANIKSNFITEIISSLQFHLSEYGYSTIIVDYQENVELEKKYLSILMKRMVDGIVLFPEENEENIIRLIQEKNIPVLMIDNLVESVECDAVLTDNVSAIYQATEQLVKRNHRRIGMITGPVEMYTARERLRGYMQAHEDYNIQVDDDLIVNDSYNIDGGYRCMEKLLSLQHSPTAVLISNYYMAIGALKALHENKIRIPEDLSVISMDELEFSCILETEITIIKQSTKEIGEISAERIIKRIKGDMTDFPEISYLRTEIVYTDSVREV